MAPQLILGHLKILADRDLLFVPDEELVLQLSGGVAIRARVGAGPVDNQRGARTLINVARQVDGLAPFRGHREVYSSGIQEGLRRDALSGVRFEIILHQFEEFFVAHLGAQRIEKDGALVHFQLMARAAARFLQL